MPTTHTTEYVPTLDLLAELNRLGEKARQAWMQTEPGDGMDSYHLGQIHGYWVAASLVRSAITALVSE